MMLDLCLTVYYKPDSIVQSVVSLIADPGVVNLIPIPPHTFVEIEHAIFPPKSFC